MPAVFYSFFLSYSNLKAAGKTFSDNPLKTGWRPRRLGGGLGNSRRAPSPIRNEVDDIRRRGGYGFAGDDKRDAARERAKLIDRSKRDKKDDRFELELSLNINEYNLGIRTDVNDQDHGTENEIAAIDRGFNFLLYSILNT